MAKNNSKKGKDSEKITVLDVIKFVASLVIFAVIIGGSASLVVVPWWNNSHYTIKTCHLDKAKYISSQGGLGFSASTSHIVIYTSNCDTLHYNGPTDGKTDEEYAKYLNNLSGQDIQVKVGALQFNGKKLTDIYGVEKK